MKKFEISVGDPREDALFLHRGFTVVYSDNKKTYRQCYKEFVFKTLTPKSGDVKLEFEMMFQDQTQEMTIYVNESEIATVQPKSNDWEHYNINFNIDDIKLNHDYITIKCVLKNDPFYPPKQPIKLSSIMINAQDDQELISKEDLIKDRIQQYPIKLNNCHRTYHEIRKLTPTYNCQADQFKYSDEKNIYFGDVHVHTEYSRCGAPFNGSMEQNVIWAKERNHDFICFADHAESMDEEEFKRYFEEAEELSKKYDILIIPCIEWTSFEYGHRNLYLNGYNVPFLSSHMFDTNTPKKLKSFLNNKNIEGFAITHHPAYVSHPADIRSIDDTFEPLIEIYSTWGSSEKYNAPLQEIPQTNPGSFVVDALNLGKKVGFVGGGDVHNTKPGDGGITGVIANELTLNSIYSALKNRLCYAVANDKIKLDFHINGYPMGSIIKANQYSIDKLFPLHIAASTICEKPILKMELIQNGEVVYEKTHREAKNEMDLFVEYDKLMTPSRITNPWNGHLVNFSRYYYIRVTQVDGCMAWSSPIWIEFVPNE